MEWKAKWIKPAQDMGDIAPAFWISFEIPEEITDAKLYMTALGVYEAHLNGMRVGDFVLAPGWTSYYNRLQYQAYDVTELLRKTNDLEVVVGKGWHRSRMPGWQPSDYQAGLRSRPCGLLAQLEVTCADGRVLKISTDEQWQVSESRVRFSEIYDGEVYDASLEGEEIQNPAASARTAQPACGRMRLQKNTAAAAVFDGPYDTLLLQEGEDVREQERISPARIFVTPKGETIVDFGQNLTGYVETAVTAHSGEVIDLSFAEVLDREGNFYTENYRGAKAQYHYVCCEGSQNWHPHLTFYGFRYIRVNQFPECAKEALKSAFTAIVVHSQMKRTGYLSCSDPLLNQFFSNVIWGQKSNFVDVPTDCPQRDERLGWTGDAQVFGYAACLNFDAERFFTKWLADLAADQHEDGYVGHVIPDVLQAPCASSAWGDAATICPWTVYLVYGNPEILRRQYESMKKWIRYIGSVTTTEYLWTGGEHYGDWLGLDAPSGSYKGSSREAFIASAFYAYSTSLVIKAGKVLGEDVSEYETLYSRIVETFRSAFPTYTTQTECVLAAQFHLAEDDQAAADQLAQMIRDCGVQLQTGFVGTPYLLHVLSQHGYGRLAYSLLLRREYPSWLYPVTKGATTVWEHWDGIMEDGGFWSSDMNSFNHYAYGSVVDWVYGVAAGIRPVEDAPGFAKVQIAPMPDARLGWLKAELDTRHGHISSGWKKEEDVWRYEITTPVEAEIVIDGETHHVPAGSYCFYSAVK